MHVVAACRVYQFATARVPTVAHPCWRRIPVWVDPLGPCDSEYAPLVTLEATHAAVRPARAGLDPRAIVLSAGACKRIRRAPAVRSRYIQITLLAIGLAPRLRSIQTWI